MPGLTALAFVVSREKSLAATKEEIAEWVKRGKKNKKCTHVVIVCDTFDWDDYPVEVKEGESIDSVIKHYDGPNMQKVMEVYSMKMDIDQQLAERRSYHPNHK